MKMNPTIKARWVAALRSGEYRQTKESLRDNGGHCCLGVLCDLFAKERGRPRWRRDDLSERSEGSSPGQFDKGLPGAMVVMWSGLDANHRVTINGKRQCLWEHNDDGRTFLEIADAIEAQL